MPKTLSTTNPSGKVISAAAKRALKDAKARRETQDNPPVPPEKNGPKGLEPTRFGDWERNGIAYDF